MREGPRSFAGVWGPRAAWGGPSWSLAVTGESDVNLRTRSRTEPARWNGEGPVARGVGSRFWAGWRGLSTDRERWQGRGPAGSDLFVSEGPLAGPWAAGGSVGPGRSLLVTCLSVPEEAGGSWGSGLAVALGGLAGGSGLPGASAAGHCGPAGSRGGSGEAVGGELSGEAAELGVPPAGALSRSVTEVTSWLMTSGGVGVGSRTSACCSCSFRSGTSRRSSLCAAARPWPSSREPLLGRPLHNLPATVAASIS